MDRPTTFYKYMTCETARKVLENMTLQWSCPLLFNDIFDVRHSLSIWTDKDILKTSLKARYKELLESDCDIPLRPDSILYGSPIDNRDCRKFLLQHLDQIVEEGSLAAFAQLEDLSRRIYEPMLRMSRVLSLSATKISTLMWSHYAASHFGIVLELGTGDPESPWCQARQMRYKDPQKIGEFIDLDKWVDFLCGIGERPSGTCFSDEHILTKSSEWNYEDEWRCIYKSTSADPGVSYFAVRPHEIIGVYFGARCLRADRDRLQALCRQQSIFPRYYSARLSGQSLHFEVDNDCP